MILNVPVTFTNIKEWVRQAAFAINQLIKAQVTPYPPSDAEPSDPRPGQGYYDTITNKLRIWDGTVWNDLW